MNTSQSLELLALTLLLGTLPAEDPRRETAYRRVDALLGALGCRHEVTLGRGVVAVCAECGARWTSEGDSCETRDR